MMGIRLKLLASLMALVLLPLIGTQTWLSWRLNSSYTDIETDTLGHEMRRLLVAVDAQLQQQETLVNDWANWTEFADYASSGQGPFAQNNLGQEAIAAAGFDWLAVLDKQGRLLHRVSHTDTRPEQVLRSPWGVVLRRAPDLGERSCGLARQRDRWVLLCRQGIRNSAGLGDPRGLLLVGQTLPKDFEAQLQRLTGLNFSLHAVPPPDVPQARTGAHLRSELGATEYRYRVDPEHLQAWWPVHDRIGTPVGHLRLDFPRTVSIQARSDLGTVQWQLLGFFILITGGLLVLIDRLVVRRLLRFSHELRAIHQRERWHDQITVDGRDEITQLAQDTNNLLGLIHFQLENLELMAESDALTGLPNRRSFDGALQRALATHKRHGRPLCLVLVDVDHFKAYNDRHGHAQGDTALKAVAQSLLAQAQRPGDLPARIGGEEFAVILEDTPAQGAERWMERVQARLQALAIAHGDSPASPWLTFSAGLVSARADENVDSLFQRADAALYQAKAQGRNQTVYAP